MLHTGWCIRSHGICNAYSIIADILRFTYSITFAAIITAIAGDVALWEQSKGIVGSVLFFLLPLILICVNSLGVRVSFNIGEFVQQDDYTNVLV